MDKETLALALAIAKKGGGGGGGSSIIDDTTTASDKTWSSNKISSEFNNLPNPMVFKGTLGSGGTITTLPTASSSNEGYTYKVITAGTYASQSAEVGDVFVSNATAWVLIPSGDDVEDTWRNIKVNGVEVLGNAISTGALDLVQGNKIKITESNGVVTIASTDKVLTNTLNAGSTSIQFTDSSIDSTKTIEVFTDPEIFHNGKSITNNTLTITFDAQASDVSVRVRIS